MRNCTNHKIHDGKYDGRQCLNQHRNRIKQTLCQSHNQLQRCIQNHRQAVNQTLHDGNDCLHCCWNQRRKCLADALHQRHHNLNGRINQQRQIFNQCVYDGHQCIDYHGDKFRQHGKYGVQHLRKQVNHGIQKCRKKFSHCCKQGVQSRWQCRYNVFDYRRDVGQHILERIHHIVAEHFNVCICITETYDKVIDGSLHGVQRTLNGVFRLCCRCTRHTHALLNHMDGRNHIGIGTDIILNTGNRLCIGKQTFHFSLGAAVTEFQVVQHCIVLLGKSLVCVLDESDIRTHLIGVIRHIRNGHIRILYCRLGISSEGRNKGGRKRCDRGHIVICRHTRRLIGIGSISLQFLRRFFEKGIHTTD